MNIKMREHHRRVVDQLRDRFIGDGNFQAMLVGGSIAKGWERDDSDVDIMLIAADEEYTRRQATNQMNYFDTQMCDYPGGYVDGKILDLRFLGDVAEKGSEPARSAFAGVEIVFSRIPGLEDLLRRITVYDESQYIPRVTSFFAQVQAYQWFISEAEKRGQKYLMLHAVSDIVLFGCRMILAYNRMLYPYHKWLLNAVQDAPQKPANFMSLVEALMNEPCKRNADAFVECVVSFTEWPRPAEGWPSRFMLDSELGWRRGVVDVSDW